MQGVSLAAGLRGDLLRGDLLRAGKSEAWKIELALLLRSRTTVTNRWLGVHFISEPATK